jgi:hypothetical protein
MVTTEVPNMQLTHISRFVITQQLVEYDDVPITLHTAFFS